MPNESAADNPVAMLMWRARELHREGKWLHAVQCYTQVIDEYPDHAPAYAALAGIYLERDQTRAARDLLQRGLTHQPDDIQLNLALGDVSLLEEDHGHAVRCFRTVLNEDPGNLRALFRIGLALARDSRNAEAISYLTKLRHARPDYPGLAELLGSMYLSVGEPERAVSVLLPDEKRDPENGALAYLLGQAFVQLERWGDAMPRLRRAVALRPDDPEAMRALGWALVKLESFSEAEKWLTRAVERFPDFLPAHANLAVLYLMQGKMEEGWETLNTAWSLDPENERLAEFIKQWEQTGDLPEDVTIEGTHGTRRTD